MAVGRAGRESGERMAGPSVREVEEPWLEVHLFSYEGTAYGNTAEIELRDFIRPEQKFDDLCALKIQIKEDVTEAQARIQEGA